MSQNWKLIRKHFQRVDSVMADLAERLELEELEKVDNYLAHLCRQVIGQQFSGKVAKVIFQRFVLLFPKSEIDPKFLLSISDEKLRSAGMAYAKVRSLKDIANRVLSGELELSKFDKLTDERVKEELIRVKGIGPWTAEMFLIFTLARQDVFSPLDLGLRKSIQKLYELEVMPTPIQAEVISQKWSPYRSVASRLLWKYLDNE